MPGCKVKLKFPAEGAVDENSLQLSVVQYSRGRDGFTCKTPNLKMRWWAHFLSGCSMFTIHASRDCETPFENGDSWLEIGEIHGI